MCKCRGSFIGFKLAQKLSRKYISCASCKRHTQIMFQKFLHRFLYTEHANILANMCFWCLAFLLWSVCNAARFELCVWDVLEFTIWNQLWRFLLGCIEILQDLNAQALQMHSPCVHSHFAHVYFVLVFEFSVLPLLVVVLAMAAEPQRLYIGGWKMGITRQDSSQVQWRFILKLRSFAQSILRCSCLT